jgi:hypothetical protein
LGFYNESAVTLLLSILLAQDAAKDVLVLKDGKLAVGTLTEVTDGGVTLRTAQGASRSFSYDDLDPYSAYEARRTRVKADDAAGRVALGDFCVGRKIYRFAVNEYRAAAELKPELKAQTDAKIAAASEADATHLLAQAELAVAAAKLEAAAKALRAVIQSYPELPQAQKAKERLEALASKIEQENQQKLEQQKKAKAALQAPAEEAQELLERTTLARALKFVEDARRYWALGMDREGEGKPAEADRAWKDSIERLNLARQEFEALIKSNDIEMIKQVKALRPEADAGLLRAYLSLAQLYADQNRLQDATLWVNQALKMDPNHANAQALKMEITKALLRQKNP